MSALLDAGNLKMPKFQSPLITCEQLHSILADNNTLVLDASIPPIGSQPLPDAKWPDVCIKGAIRCDINGVFSDHNNNSPHTMLSAKAFELAARAIGVNNDSVIVAYDDLGLFSAARIWWMFKAMGHKNVYVLNGGLPQWLKLQLPTARADDSTQLQQGNFIAKRQTQLFCDKDQVLKAIDDNAVTILDARSAERYSGMVAEPRAGVRKGHIPGSVNLPYSNLLDNGLFKSNSEVSQLLLTHASKDKQLVMSCGSGVTACILALAAEISGFESVSVYDGSWSEWGSDHNLPIA